MPIVNELMLQATQTPNYVGYEATMTMSKNPIIPWSITCLHLDDLFKSMEDDWLTIKAVGERGLFVQAKTKASN